MRPPDPKYRRGGLKAALERNGRTSPGARSPLRGLINPAPVRQRNRIAAQYDRPSPPGISYPVVSENPVRKVPLKRYGLHPGVNGRSRPHRYSSS